MCIQRIWILGVQEFVLCVWGDMHGVLSVAIGGCLCLNQYQVMHAEREDEEWQASKT